MFNDVHNWAKLYARYNFNINLTHTFLSGSGTAGKFHLVKTIYNVVSKSLLFHYKEPEKRILLLELTGISAVNIAGTTIHSTLGIKPGAKLIGLSDKRKRAIRE